MSQGHVQGRESLEVGDASDRGSEDRLVAGRERGRMVAIACLFVRRE